MSARKIYYILLVCSLVLLQLTVVGNLKFFDGRVNLTLVLLVILISLADFSWVIIFSVATGLVLDVYSGLPFGVMAFSLCLSAIFLRILFINFFTNFSFHSLLLLGFIAVVGYGCIFAGLIGALYLIGLSDYLPAADYLSKVLWQVGTTELIMIAAYFFISPLSRRFKPVFLG